MKSLCTVCAALLWVCFTEGIYRQTSLHSTPRAILLWHYILHVTFLALYTLFTVCAAKVMVQLFSFRIAYMFITPMASNPMPAVVLL